MTAVDGIVLLLTGLGGVFCVIGMLGVVRFPDVYARLHAAGVTDTLGTMLVVGGLLTLVFLGDGGVLGAVLDGDTEVAKTGVLRAFKLVSIVFFMWVSGTTAVHALAKSAWLAGVEPWTADGPDDDGGAPSSSS